MKKTITNWPDTTGALPPGDHPYGVALWLLGRHPQLAHLVDRVPGIAGVENGRASLNLDLLAAAFAEVDAYKAAYKEAFGWNVPSDAEADRFQADQPNPGPAADELLVMSSTELSRLRLLATLSSEGVQFKVSHFRAFDDAGNRLLGDWLDAVRNG
ncbi:hypothetical protein ACFCV3_41660 [Kribbella sp. NPDC056345]|uniref:hypothetical protein n=1 Tax=Kribbella sp. NPDC056345 TaxID=3345789 RepID=UPI0035DC207D